MNTLDIILLVVAILPGVWTGLKKGFVFQAITLVSLYVSILLSLRFANGVERWLCTLADLPEKFVKVIAFIIILCAVYLAMYLLGTVLRKIIKDITGGWVDKLLGVFLGILKYCLIAGLVLMLFDTINGFFNFVSRETLDASVMYRGITRFTSYILSWQKFF